MKGEVQLEVQALYLDSASEVGGLCGAFRRSAKDEGHPPK